MTLNHQRDTLADSESKPPGPASIELIWLRYHARLVDQARHELRARGVRSGVDAEDVVSTAFCSLLSGIRRGRHAGIEDPDEWWRLMRVITHRRLIGMISFRLRGHLTYGLPESMPNLGDLPDAVALGSELFKRRLDALTPRGRLIALSKFEACTTEEIASQLNCSTSTVWRELRKIRRTWTSMDVEPRFAPA